MSPIDSSCQHVPSTDILAWINKLATQAVLIELALQVAPVLLSSRTACYMRVAWLNLLANERRFVSAYSSTIRPVDECQLIIVHC